MKLEREMSGLRKAINANTSVLQSLRQLMEQPVLPTTERRSTAASAASAALDPHDLLWADSPQGAFHMETSRLIVFHFQLLSVPSF